MSTADIGDSAYWLIAGYVLFMIFMLAVGRRILGDRQTKRRARYVGRRAKL